MFNRFSFFALALVGLGLGGCLAGSDIEPRDDGHIVSGVTDMGRRLPWDDQGLDVFDFGDQGAGDLPAFELSLDREVEYLPPACPTKGLAQALTIYEIDGALGAASNPHIVPTDRGGAILAVSRPEGMILSWVDGLGRLVGASQLINARAVLALARGPAGVVGALVEGQEVGSLELVILSYDGQELGRQRVASPAALDKIGQWRPSTTRQAAALSFDGQRWIAYFTVDRRWPDQKIYQGDMLRYFLPDGSFADGGWAWGCSQSMELALGVVQGQAAPVCASDCYPRKGVLLAAKSLLYGDAQVANCAGDYGTALAGVVPYKRGAWVGFVGRQEDRRAQVGMVRLDERLLPGPVRWVSAQATLAKSPALAQLGAARLLAGWFDQERSYLARLEAESGKPELEAEAVGQARLDRASRFVTLANGDVAWAFMADSRKLALARVCRP